MAGDPRRSGGPGSPRRGAAHPIGSTSGDVTFRVGVAVDRADLDAARAGFLSDLAPMLALFAGALIVALANAVQIALRPLSTVGRRVGALNRRETRGWTTGAGRGLALAVEIDTLLKAREAELQRARLRPGSGPYPEDAPAGPCGRRRASNMGT